MLPSLSVCRVWSLLVVLAFAVQVASATPRGYTVVDLGAEATPHGISADGIVVGEFLEFPPRAAILWPTFATLPGIRPDADSAAFGIADTSGGTTVVGTYSPLGPFAHRAFRVTTGQGLVDLGMPGLFSGANAVNAAGTICGLAELEQGILVPVQPVLWIADVLTPLPGNGAQGVCSALNDEGDAVGFQAAHCMAWPAEGGYIDCHDAPVGVSRARDINNHWQIVGSRTIPPGHGQGFVWTLEDGQIPLDPLPGDNVTSAEVINDQGVILGRSLLQQFTDPLQPGILSVRGVRWHHGVPSDLTALLVDAEGWEVMNPVGINADGLIIADCLYHEEMHGCLLMPVARPPRHHHHRQHDRHFWDELITKQAAKCDDRCSRWRPGRAWWQELATE
jgi:hypothetical protein